MRNSAVNILVTAFIICAVGAKILPQKSHVDCSKKSKILWPDYNDKKFYFECIGEDNFVKRPCPSKTVFNYFTQQCTWPEDWVKPPEFDNFIEPQEETSTTVGSEYSPSCSINELHIFWPDPTNLRDYFICTGIRRYKRMSCRVGEEFAFKKQMCVQESPTTTTLIPRERMPSCLEHELHITWADPWEPQYYFICTGIGTFEIRKCPEGFIFQFMVQKCVRSFGLAPFTTTTTTTAVTSTIGLQAQTAEANTISYPIRKCLICWRPTCERKEMHLDWPDFDSKNNYFKCLSEGVLILKSCEGNLTFDFDAQKCVEEINNSIE